MISPNAWYKNLFYHIIRNQHSNREYFWCHVYMYLCVNIGVINSSTHCTHYVNKGSMLLPVKFNITGHVGDIDELDDRGPRYQHQRRLPLCAHVCNILSYLCEVWIWINNFTPYFKMDVVTFYLNFHWKVDYIIYFIKRNVHSDSRSRKMGACGSV